MCDTISALIHLTQTVGRKLSKECFAKSLPSLVLKKEKKESSVFFKNKIEYRPKLSTQITLLSCAENFWLHFDKYREYFSQKDKENSEKFANLGCFWKMKITQLWVSLSSKKSPNTALIAIILWKNHKLRCRIVKI